jgi:hypothetical protein
LSFLRFCSKIGSLTITTVTFSVPQVFGILKEQLRTG